MLSRFRPKRGSPAATYDRNERTRNAALEESGRDPFAESLQSMIPINRATRAGIEGGPLAGVGSFLGSGAQMRGGVGDPSVTAKALLSRFRPQLPNRERPPTIRAFREQGIEAPPPPSRADKILDAGVDLPYTAGGEGLPLMEGAGAHAARLSPSREFAPGAWEEILKNMQAGGLDEKRRMMHELYNQFLDSAIYGSTYN